VNLITFAVQVVWLAGALVVGLVIGLSLLAVMVGRFIPGAELLIGLGIRLVLGLVAWSFRLAARFVRGAVVDHPLLTAVVGAAALEKRWIVVAVPGWWWLPWVINVALLSLAGMGVVRALSGDNPNNTRANAIRLHRAGAREFARMVAVGEAARQSAGSVAEKVRARRRPPPPLPPPPDGARRNRFAELVDRHRRRHRADVGTDPYASDAEKVDTGALTPDQATARAAVIDAAAEDPYASPTERRTALADPDTAIPVGAADTGRPAPVTAGATP
jgi:hypothetical protein